MHLGSTNAELVISNYLEIRDVSISAEDWSSIDSLAVIENNKDYEKLNK